MTDTNQYGGSIQPMPSPYGAPSLAQWLTARLDEDERVAKGGGAARYSVTSGGDPEAEAELFRHIAAWNPARVLTEIAAKRAILALHDRQQHCCPASFNPAGAVHGTVWGIPDGDDYRPECATLLMLARPYAGHPGWREEWGAKE